MGLAQFRDAEEVAAPVAGVSPGLYRFEPVASHCILNNRTGETAYCLLNNTTDVASESLHDVFVDNLETDNLLGGSHTEVFGTVQVWLPLGADPADFSVRGI